VHETTHAVKADINRSHKDTDSKKDDQKRKKNNSNSIVEKEDPESIVEIQFEAQEETSAPIEVDNNKNKK
jgi:hypothetical protein